MIAGWILVALAAAHAARLGGWAVGLRRVVNEVRPAVPDARLPSLTVVVPARNEQDTVGACVDSVLAQDYPADRLTVIVVDDDSQDATSEVVRQRMTPAYALAGGDAADVEGDGRLRLVRIPENRRRERAHKKAAIEKAVAHATGDVILTTDADCTVPPGWARAMASAFE